jgi:formylmethanofuran dehydrogenase subunit E
MFELFEEDMDQVEVKWLPRSAFAGRVVIVGPPVMIIPVPDDFIVCDWCGAVIKDDPVAVIGTDAVCGQCLATMSQ